MTDVIEEIQNWCQYSGAELSLPKCKTLHICRKIKCKMKIKSNSCPLASVNNLKILGLVFNDRYSWKPHIDALAQKSYSRTNILKCLSSKRFSCNTISLISVLKPLILPTLDYGIHIYGFTTKANIQKLNSVINTAIRVALGAFRTTSTNNLLLESKIYSFEVRRDESTTKLISLLYNSHSSPIGNIAKKAHKVMRIEKKLTPSISKCLSLCQKSGIDTRLPSLPVPRSLHGN